MASAAGDAARDPHNLRGVGDLRRAEAFHLPQGYWAVITGIVVMQGSLGATLGASLDRLLATVMGAAVGGIWVVVREQVLLPQALVLIFAVAPMALLAALRSSFRLAPITAVIVLLGAPPGDGLLTAFHRMAEIALGCVLGGLTAQLVLPDRARGIIEANAAAALEALGQLASAYLRREPDTAVDRITDAMRRHLAAIAAAASDEARERAMFLRTGPPAEPMLRALRRLRSDVAMVGRAMAGDPDADGTAAAEVLAAHFSACAALVQGGREDAPSLDRVDAMIGAVSASSMLGFAVTTLRRDLADLEERLTERRVALSA